MTKICIVDKDGKETKCLVGDLRVGDTSLLELSKRVVELENSYKKICSRLNKREEELTKAWQRLK